LVRRNSPKEYCNIQHSSKEYCNTLLKFTQEKLRISARPLEMENAKEVIVEEPQIQEAMEVTVETEPEGATGVTSVAELSISAPPPLEIHEARDIIVESEPEIQEAIEVKVELEPEGAPRELLHAAAAAMAVTRKVSTLYALCSSFLGDNHDDHMVVLNCCFCILLTKHWFPNGSLKMVVSKWLMQIS
jgi:hypothetical protein